MWVCISKQAEEKYSREKDIQEFKCLPSEHLPVLSLVCFHQQNHKKD